MESHRYSNSWKAENIRIFVIARWVYTADHKWNSKISIRHISKTQQHQTGKRNWQFVLSPPIFPCQFATHTVTTVWLTSHLFSLGSTATRKNSIAMIITDRTENSLSSPCHRVYTERLLKRRFLGSGVQSRKWHGRIKS